MSFLFPLYLLGAAAIAVPILLHLRRRPPKEHMAFGSLMFLEKSPERLTRRTRLDRWLLLLLRCLAVILLALAFGRPFLKSFALPNEEKSITRAIVLVDRSASMRRENLWEKALSSAKLAISEYKSDDEVAVAFFDESFDLAADFPAWAALGPNARSENFSDLAGEQPGWFGTDLGLAMTRAADLLVATDSTRPVERREIVLIGDFQSGADRDALNRITWPEEVAVRCIALAPKESGNLSLNLAATPLRSNIDDIEAYRVRISNAADSEFASVTLGWKGFPETEVETRVAPGTGRILSSTPRPAGAERGTLVITGDSQPFDNEVYVSPVQARPLRVLFINESGTTDSAGSPLFYLQRALQPTPALDPILTTAESVTDSELNLQEVAVVAGNWSGETAEKLQAFAEKGGLVLAIPSPSTESDAFAELVDEPWKLTEADGNDYAMLADLDFEHPVLAPFARAQIRDFTKIRFWKHRQLELSDPIPDTTRVLATFDGESPAWIEHRVGDGAVFAFLSGWEPEESQLALSSKFVPLLYSIFEHTGFSIESAPTLYVGENNRERPGFYEEESGLIAVNLRPGEGLTAPFDPAVVFGELGIPLIDEETPADLVPLTKEQQLRVEFEEKEERQKLWKWLVLAALVILIIETLLAGRRRATPTPAAA